MRTRTRTRTTGPTTLAALRQRHEHRRRLVAGDDDLTRRKAPAGKRALDEPARPPGTIAAELLQGEEPVVGDEHAGGGRPQHASGHVHDPRQLAGRELGRPREQRCQGTTKGRGIARFGASPRWRRHEAHTLAYLVPPSSDP